MTTVANFAIDYRQYLNEHGEVNTKLPDFANNSDTLIQNYQDMVLTRTFDLKAVTLQRTGKLGTFPPILGQEALSVGIGSSMQKDDVLVPSYRDHGAQFQRGVSMQEVLLYWGGDERGSNFASANAKDDLPISVPIASQYLHAAGIAKAFQYRQQKRVAVTFCGDGGTSEGDFYEAINLAGTWKLPVVFIVSNNQWAISVPRDIQSGCETLAQKAIAAGFTGVQVDGNDIIAVREASLNALEHARNGNGPALIEAITYRLGDHTTADDAKRYRSREETNAAWQREPIARLKSYLVNIGVWNEEQEKNLQTQCAAKVEKAVKAFLDMPKPNVTEIFDSLYAQLPEALIEQREEAISEASS